MPQSRTIAIAGATGGLGKYITEAILSEQFKGSFKEVVVLSRKASETTKEFERQGATVRIYKEDDRDNLRSVLQDANVYVNTIGPTGHQFKRKLMDVLPQTSVVLDFMSEWGVDHDCHDFMQQEWDIKKRQYQRAKALLPNIKIVRVFAGLFLDDSLGPWFGFDNENKKYEAIGSSSAKISFTGKHDVGRAVATLATMPLEKIPDDVRLSGSVGSFESIAKIMGAAGAGDIKISVLDLQKFKTEAIIEDTLDPLKYLRFLMGEGKINHDKDGLGNDNEVVNPGEKNWKWKTLEDMAKELKGKDAGRETAGGYEGK